MSLARYGRSKLGAFIRSPLGVKCDGNTFKRVASDHLNLIESRTGRLPSLIQSLACCLSIRRDSPTLGTQIGGIFTRINDNGSLGKSTSVSDTAIRRSRTGITFKQFASVYPVGTEVYLHIEFNNWSNTFGETPPVWIFASTTDDIALYTDTEDFTTKTVLDWEENVDDFIIEVPYGTLGKQRILISNGTIAAHLGQKLSIVIVTKEEVTETGITTWPGNTPPKFAGCDKPIFFGGDNVVGHGFVAAELEILKP